MASPSSRSNEILAQEHLNAPFRLSAISIARAISFTQYLILGDLATNVARANEVSPSSRYEQPVAIANRSAFTQSMIAGRLRQITGRYLGAMRPITVADFSAAHRGNPDFPSSTERHMGQPFGLVAGSPKRSRKRDWVRESSWARAARRLARNASARSSTSAIRRCSASGGRLTSARLRYL